MTFLCFFLKIYFPRFFNKILGMNLFSNENLGKNIKSIFESRSHISHIPSGCIWHQKHYFRVFGVKCPFFPLKGPLFSRMLHDSICHCVCRSVCRSVGPSVGRRSVGLSVHRSVSPLVRRSVGPSVRRSQLSFSYSFWQFWRSLLPLPSCATNDAVYPALFILILVCSFKNWLLVG